MKLQRVVQTKKIDSGTSSADHSESSLSSTVSVTTTLKTSAEELNKEKHLSRSHRVQFNPSKNAVYPSKHAEYTKNLKTTLWYSMEEMKSFKKDAIFMVRSMHKQEKQSENPDKSWPKMILSAYDCFREEPCAAQVRETLHNLHIRPPLVAMGLETKCISVVLYDRMSRRRELLEIILHWQDTPISDESKRAQRIRRACRSVSRPSRLMAHFLAMMWLHHASESTSGDEQMGNH